MSRIPVLAALAAILVYFAPAAASAQRSPDYGPPIMLPEPWLAPKYQSAVRPQYPNRTKRAVRRLRVIQARPIQPVPQTRVVPSFLSGRSGVVSFPPDPPRVLGAPPSVETYSDRVSRCVHYGTATGVSPNDMAVYTHTCAF